MGSVGRGWGLGAGLRQLLITTKQAVQIQTLPHFPTHPHTFHTHVRRLLLEMLGAMDWVSPATLGSLAGMQASAMEEALARDVAAWAAAWGEAAAVTASAATAAVRAGATVASAAAASAAMATASGAGATVAPAGAAAAAAAAAEAAGRQRGLRASGVLRRLERCGMLRWDEQQGRCALPGRSATQVWARPQSVGRECGQAARSRMHVLTSYSAGHAGRRVYLVLLLLACFCQAVTCACFLSMHRAEPLHCADQLMSPWGRHPTPSCQ